MSEQPLSRHEVAEHPGADERRNIVYSRGFLVAAGVAAMVACTAVVLVVVPEDWSMARTLGAGTFLGAWCFFCVFVNHVLITGAPREH